MEVDFDRLTQIVPPKLIKDDSSLRKALTNHIKKTKNLNHSGFNVFLLYHAEVEDLLIDATGIKDPKKVQNFMPLYPLFVAASISRINNMASKEDLLILLLDRKSIHSVSKLIAKKDFNLEVLYIDIGTLELVNEPMWCRFQLVRQINNLLRECNQTHNLEIIAYSLDSDYIPSYTLFKRTKSFKGIDFIFTTNKNSYPLWQINEGVYIFKVGSKSAKIFDRASSIYEFLNENQVVLQYWKNPRIWRGAQASLMLTMFKFNQHIQEEQFIYLKSFDIRIKRLVALG